MPYGTSPVRTLSGHGWEMPAEPLPKGPPVRECLRRVCAAHLRRILWLAVLGVRRGTGRT